MSEKIEIDSTFTIDLGANGSYEVPTIPAAIAGVVLVFLLGILLGRKSKRVPTMNDFFNEFEEEIGRGKD